MKWKVIVAAALLNAPVLALGAEISLRPGDCWSYDTRPGEEESFVVIRKVETLPELGEVAEISIFGLKLKSVRAPNGFVASIPNAFYSAGALRASLRERVTRTIPEIDWELGDRLGLTLPKGAHRSAAFTPLKQYIVDMERFYATTQPIAIDPAGRFGMSRQIQQLPEWRARQTRFALMMGEVRAGDPSGRQALDTILWQIKANPFSPTPIETLELLGFYYLPKDGIEKTLPRIVAAMAVGWYDALRFASPAGRAELEDTESFFIRPLFVADNDAKQEALRFLAEHPARRQELVAEGLALAESMRHDSRFDHHWAGTLIGGEAPPLSTQYLSRLHWSEAWEETKTKVSKAVEAWRSQAAPGA